MGVIDELPARVRVSRHRLTAGPALIVPRPLRS